MTSEPEALPIKVMQVYHEVRFTYDPRRLAVWKAICRYLQPWVAEHEGLLELGAGYGEFSREIRAARKWALDMNPSLADHWGASVTPLIQSAMEPLPLAAGTLGTVFASNFFEHFTIEQGAGILAEASRVLRSGGPAHSGSAQLPAGTPAILRRLHASNGIHRHRVQGLSASRELEDCSLRAAVCTVQYEIKAATWSG